MIDGGRSLSCGASLQVSDALSLTRPDLSGDEAFLNKPILLNVSTDGGIYICWFHYHWDHCIGNK